MSEEKNKSEVDEYTGTDTTGHEWDGIKELDSPMPRWWLWCYLASVVWAIGYWAVYPAWPLINDATSGFLGTTQRQVVASDLEESRNAKAIYAERLLASDLETIRSTPDLLQFAMAGGKASFGDNCAGCHGSGAQGAVGYPNLNDDEWLWGGSLDEIHTTISVGIRSVHEDTRINDMPAFLRDELLSRDEIDEIADYVLTINDTTDRTTQPAHEMFIDNCSTCHGEDGKGLREFGAPDLTDQVWLFGQDKEMVVDVISNSRKGVMPTWSTRLDPSTIKGLAVYVHSLGGGE